MNDDIFMMVEPRPMSEIKLNKNFIKHRFKQISNDDLTFVIKIILAALKELNIDNVDDIYYKEANEQEEKAKSFIELIIYSNNSNLPNIEICRYLLYKGFEVVNELAKEADVSSINFTLLKTSLNSRYYALILENKENTSKTKL